MKNAIRWFLSLTFLALIGVACNQALESPTAPATPTALGDEDGTLTAQGPTGGGPAGPSGGGGAGPTGGSGGPGTGGSGGGSGGGGGATPTPPGATPTPTASATPTPVPTPTPLPAVNVMIISQAGSTPYNVVDGGFVDGGSIYVDSAEFTISDPPPLSFFPFQRRNRNQDLLQTSVDDASQATNPWLTVDFTSSVPVSVVLFIDTAGGAPAWVTAEGFVRTAIAVDIGTARFSEYIRNFGTTGTVALGPVADPAKAMYFVVFSVTAQDPACQCSG